MIQRTERFTTQILQARAERLRGQFGTDNRVGGINSVFDYGLLSIDGCLEAFADTYSQFMPRMVGLGEPLTIQDKKSYVASLSAYGLSLELHAREMELRIRALKGLRRNLSAGIQQEIVAFQNTASTQLTTLRESLSAGHFFGTSGSRLPVIKIGETVSADENRPATTELVAVLDRTLEAADVSSPIEQELILAGLSILIDAEDTGVTFQNIPNFEQIIHPDTEIIFNQAVRGMKRYTETYVQILLDSLAGRPSREQKRTRAQLDPLKNQMLQGIVVQYLINHPSVAYWMLAPLEQSIPQNAASALTRYRDAYDQDNGNSIFFLRENAQSPALYDEARRSYLSGDAQRFADRLGERIGQAISAPNAEDVRRIASVSDRERLISEFEGKITRIDTPDDPDIKYIALSASKGTMFDIIIVSRAGETLLLQNDQATRIFAGLTTQQGQTRLEDRIFSLVAPHITTELEQRSFLAPKPIPRRAISTESEPTQTASTLVKNNAMDEPIATVHVDDTATDAHASLGIRQPTTEEGFPIVIHNSGDAIMPESLVREIQRYFAGMSAERRAEIAQDHSLVLPESRAIIGFDGFELIDGVLRPHVKLLPGVRY